MLLQRHFGVPLLWHYPLNIQVTPPPPHTRRNAGEGCKAHRAVHSAPVTVCATQFKRNRRIGLFCWRARWCFLKFRLIRNAALNFWTPSVSWDIYSNWVYPSCDEWKFHCNIYFNYSIFPYVRGAWAISHKARPFFSDPPNTTHTHTREKCRKKIDASRPLKALRGWANIPLKPFFDNEIAPNPVKSFYALPHIPPFYTSLAPKMNTSKS